MKYLDCDGTPWSEQLIQSSIYGDRYLKNYACIPNVLMNNNGFYEADMICINYKTGYLQEIECKVSIEDFRADFKKKKYHNHPHVRQLSYAFPEQMWNEHKEEILQRIEECGGRVGVIIIDNGHKPKTIKRAKARKHVKRLTVVEMLHYLRLGCMKIRI